MPTSGAPNPLIAEARARWKRCSEAEDAQRKAILAAKQFRAGDQWPSAIKTAREGSNALQGQSPQPPRPCLVVDRLSQPVRQTSNTIKNASFGFDVLPNGGEADTGTAEIFKGALRHMHNAARDESPVEWAADGAIEGGLGWFRLRTDYVHQSWVGDPNDPEVFDQELVEERITNNLTVYCDPSSLHPTRRNAQFMFVIEDLDKEEYKRLYGEDDIRGLEEFQSTGDNLGWVSDDTIRIAEYWRLDYTDRTFYQLADDTIVEGKKPDGEIKRQRTMRVPTVKCDKINAIKSLEQYEWVGSRIPLFPILGEELNVDGKPVLRGIIQEGMDAQRMVNYTYSGAMEIFALAPKSPYIAAEGQVEPYKAMWQTANTTNYAYLPYVPVSIGGELVGAPQRQTYEAPIQAAVELMRTSEEAIKATTSTGDASLGNSHPNERSGRALQALQAASDLSNSNYPDNVRRALIAAAEEAVIVLPKITRVGQVLHILGKDDKPEQVMIGKPFQQGANGVPQPAPPEVTPEVAKMKENLYKFYDLNSGRYAVTVTVGKASATKREEGAAALGELIPHLPPAMAAVATPDYVRQLSFPGAEKIAERLEQALPPELQKKDDQQSPLPPQIQAMLQQLQQENGQLKQAMATDQAKVQGQIQSTQIDAQVKAQASQAEIQAKLQMAHQDGQLKLQIAAMNNETQIRIEEMKLRGQAMQAEIDSAENALARQAQHQQAEQGQVHALEREAVGHQQALEQGEQGHAQALESAEQAAALQPPPAEGAGA